MKSYELLYLANRRDLGQTLHEQLMKNVLKVYEKLF